MVGTNKKLHLNTNEHRGWLAGDDKPSSDHPALRPVQRATLARRRRDAEDVWTAELGTTASYSTPCPYRKNRHSMTGARTGGPASRAGTSRRRSMHLCRSQRHRWGREPGRRGTYEGLECVAAHAQQRRGGQRHAWSTFWEKNSWRAQPPSRSPLVTRHVPSAPRRSLGSEQAAGCSGASAGSTHRGPFSIWVPSLQRLGNNQRSQGTYAFGVQTTRVSLKPLHHGFLSTRELVLGASIRS